MATKKYNPTSPGRRFMTVSTYEEITACEPEKSLLETKKKSGGRNVQGKITIRHVGGGNKVKYRVIDFKRDKDGIPAKVATIEYDPNRTANIALLNYADGEKRYILAPFGLKVGDTIVSGEKADIKSGNALQLMNIPVGTMIHNIELKPGKGGQLARAAGTYAQFVGRDGSYAQIRLSSGELRMVRQECMATIGAVSNPDNSNQNFGKAGRMRHKGIRPTVRGVAMNPIDHPHGGGEGRTSGGRHPVTPWGKPTKGARTRHNKATYKMIIRSRHSTKRKG